MSAANNQLLRSAHDLSQGGLAIALAECCIAGELGLRGQFPTAGRLDEALFGEEQSRAIVSCRPQDEKALRALSERERVHIQQLGAVGGDRLRLGPLDVAVDQLRAAYESGLPSALEAAPATPVAARAAADSGIAIPG